MSTLPPVTTALSLEGWRRVFGHMPWHFWGMADDNVLRVTADCASVVKEYAWMQADSAGRQDILFAIASAERILTEYLSFRPGAVYAEAAMPWPRPADARMVRNGWSDPQGRWMNVALPEAHVIALGVETRDLIATVSVTYSDPNGDGVSELATITTPTSVTDADQIAVYFQASDRLPGDPLSEQYRIRPLSVSIAAGVATITGPSYLFVRPINYQTVAPQDNDIDLDPADPGVLASDVSVYRRYTNTAGQTVSDSQGVIIWETRPCHGWWCCCGCQDANQGSPYDPAATAQAVARVGIRDAGRGVVIPAASVYDSTAGTWATFPWSFCTQPDRVLVRYLAGIPLVNGDMRSDWAMVTARLAAAELARPICDCVESNRALAYWQTDLAITSDTESYTVSPADLDCPWGSRRGHIQAWRFVQRMERVRGFTE